MKHFNKLRPLTLLSALSIGACNPDSRPTSVREQLARPYTPTNAAAAKTSNDPERSGRPVAMINDKPVERREIVAILMESHGLAVLQQVMLRDVALQEAARLNLTVTDADVEREYDLTLQADQLNGKDPDKLTPTRKVQLIEDWTRSRGVSARELDIAMHRQAALRKIAETHINVTDPMLLAEYNRLHGERAEVRHIQIPAPRFYTDLKARLDKGESFEELVNTYSQNSTSRQNRGLLPAFTRNDPNVPAIFTEVAFQLKPGEYSKLIEAQGSYHILKLERIIPADTASFEEVKSQVKRILTARLLAQEMDVIGRTLVNAAKYTVDDPVLKKQYEASKQLEKSSPSMPVPAR